MSCGKQPSALRELRSPRWRACLRWIQGWLFIGITCWLPVITGFASDEVVFPFNYELTDDAGRTLAARIRAIDADTLRIERIDDGRAFSVPISTLSEEDQRFFRAKAEAIALAAAAEAGPVLVPGEKVVLDFPELGQMADGQPAQCEISVPAGYDPGRPVPLLVWFSGGNGSHRTQGANGLVDFDRFLVVALPYPDGRLPRLAVNEGARAIDAFWSDFQQPMLERVIELVPNISETVRLAGGSSSGAHLVGSALDRRWRGFCDYFTGFILHEGGTSPDMRFRGTRASHRILIVYGETSIARAWQERFIEQFRRASGRHTFVEIPGAGHGLTSAGRQQIRQWIAENFDDK